MAGAAGSGAWAGLRRLPPRSAGAPARPVGGENSVSGWLGVPGGPQQPQMAPAWVEGEHPGSYLVFGRMLPR